MDKKRIVEGIVERLQTELDGNLRAARAAHEAATHEESRSEDRHDTRGLEASYLAGAQAQRAAELQQLISAYRLLPLRDWGAADPIGPGALVELEAEDGASARPSRSWVFIGPAGGGVTVVVDGRSIQVITARSPMGEELVGRRQGDGIEVELRGVVREYSVVKVS